MSPDPRTEQRRFDRDPVDAADSRPADYDAERAERAADRAERAADRADAPRTAAPADPAEPYRDPYGDPLAPAPAAAGPGDWKAAVATASGINLLAGIWLIIAPFVLGYNNADPYWNDIVFGAIVGLFALVRIAGAYRQSWLSYINALIGVWLFVSAFWLDNSGQAIWNDIILGIIVFFLGITSATASDDAAYSERAWYRR